MKKYMLKKIFLMVYLFSFVEFINLIGSLSEEGNILFKKITGFDYDVFKKDKKNKKEEFIKKISSDIFNYINGKDILSYSSSSSTYSPEKIRKITKEDIIGYVKEEIAGKRLFLTEKDFQYINKLNRLDREIIEDIFEVKFIHQFYDLYIDRLFDFVKKKLSEMPKQENSNNKDSNAQKNSFHGQENSSNAQKNSFQGQENSSNAQKNSSKLESISKYTFDFLKKNKKKFFFVSGGIALSTAIYYFLRNRNKNKINKKEKNPKKEEIIINDKLEVKENDSKDILYKNKDNKNAEKVFDNNLKKENNNIYKNYNLKKAQKLDLKTKLIIDGYRRGKVGTKIFGSRNNFINFSRRSRSKILKNHSKIRNKYKY
jgi:hypothetical protein